MAAGLVIPWFVETRTVRIRDRRLGIPYLSFLVAILAYNVFLLFFEQKYLKQASVDGVTRLQVWGVSRDL